MVADGTSRDEGVGHGREFWPRREKHNLTPYAQRVEDLYRKSDEYRVAMNDPNEEQPPATKKARRGEDDEEEGMTKEEKNQEAKGERDSVAIDTTAVSKVWSPQRASRVAIKVRSLEDGNLCGGDFVLDTDGNACTISFLFEKQRKVYGLTAGHLADVGDNLEIFAESQADEEGNYPTIDIGQVVSKDVETDSLIFQIHHPHVLTRVDLLRVLVSPKSGLNLPEPDANPTPPQEGTDVVVYGAKRRGAKGVVVIRSSDFKGKISKKGDIGVSSKTDSGESVSYGATSLTDGGDCGALYLVATSGSPIAMHHCLQNPQDEGGENTDATKGYISFGIPLANILSKHALLGGHSEKEIQKQQLYSPPAAATTQTRNMANFKTKPSTKIPMMDGTIQRPRQSPNIAKFKTRRIFIDRNGKRVSAPRPK